jgi:CII-binding regulator of phage lambda lysogenization HflD
MDQIPKKLKNTETQLSNMGFKLDQIQSKQQHIHVRNHARINNLVSIHFDYHLNIIILSKSFGSKLKP